MLKRTVVCTVICALLQSAAYTHGSDAATGVSFANPQDAGQVIKRIGEGYTKRVKLTLRDGTKLQGYISTLGDDYCAVTSIETGKTTRVSFSDIVKVQQVKPSLNKNRRPIGGMLMAIGIVVFAFGAYAIGQRKR
jgi:hypothetical protein